MVGKARFDIVMPITSNCTAEGPVVKHCYFTVSRQPHVELHGVNELALYTDGSLLACSAVGRPRCAIDRTRDQRE